MTDEQIINILNFIPLENGNYITSKNKYESYDAENFTSIVEIKKRSSYYDLSLIEKLKYTQKKLKDIVIDAYTDTDELPKYDDFNPLKILNSASVEIIDELVIPMEYFIKVETLKLDKKKILKDLKEGIKIPGCELKRKPYIRGLK